MTYVDNVPSWRRGSHILEGTRVHPTKMDVDQMEVILGKVNDTDAGTLVNGVDLVQISGGQECDIFQTKAEELYNFIASSLAVTGR